MRYRSEPCSVTVCDATADGQSRCHWGAASPGAGADGPKRQVLPMLVSSNGRFRCVSQLSPATAVTVASLLTLPFCAAVPGRSTCAYAQCPASNSNVDIATDRDFFTNCILSPVL